MVLGNSGGLICTGTGTLGLMVRKPAGAERWILSCSHVLARGGNFDAPFASLPENRKVVQQPRSDPCDPTVNRVGLLQPGFSVILDSDAQTTTEDLALALIDVGVVAVTSSTQSATNKRIAIIAAEHPGDWETNMPVWLLGAFNRNTPGTILRYMGDQPTFIFYPGIGDVRFTGLVRYEVHCQPGDSGGAVVDENNRLLGLHVAGSEGDGVGAFLPLGEWFRNNGLELA